MTLRSARLRSSGIVTLLTDFGLQDTYVGVMKGVLHARAPTLRAVVDLTHAISPQDVRAAAFHLVHSWRWFETGSVHVAVVDPGVGSARRCLAAGAHGHWFLAPDNGLLGPILAADPGARVHAIDAERHGHARRSRTFHGRDVFAPVAAALVDGLELEEVGPPVADWRRLSFPVPRVAPTRIEAEVLLADRFGNLITNAEASLLGRSPESWSIEHAGLSIPLRGTYAEAQGGALLGLVNSYGLVEIARRDGSAAAQLELAVGDAVVLSRSPEVPA
ncbi:MAG: SAM-dependent chlorinase/fluorinase [Planctomycetes bacterium]|nr:SAM-dependent chlorinase/fluorinase [Planctomycetota bacterium]